jgi:type I restriction enzyme R subunit
MKAHARLYGYLQPAVDRFNALEAAEPETAAEFRRALESYTKAYGWLSHVIGFENLELERLYQYGRFLLRRLPAPTRSAGADIGTVVPSHMRITQTGTPELHLQAAGEQALPGLVPEAGAAAAEAEEMSLAEVIRSVNAEYGTGLSTADQILLGQLVVAVSEDPELRAIALHQDQEVFGGELAKDLDRIVIDQAASNDALMVRYFDDAAVNRLFKQVATEQAYQLIRRPVRREAERRATQQRAAELKSTGSRPAQPREQ